MKKLFSLIKAVCSQDMDLFKFKNNGNKFSKIFLFTFLCIILMISFGTYYYMLAENLQQVNLTYLMLGMALVIPTIFVFMQGIYKSQNILFNDIHWRCYMFSRCYYNSFSYNIRSLQL